MGSGGSILQIAEHWTMSFGCSISDILLCGRIGYKIHEHIKEGPTHCADFARDLRFLAVLIVRVGYKAEQRAKSMAEDDYKVLESVITECWQFLWTHLLDEHPPRWEKRHAHLTEQPFDIPLPGYLSSYLQRSLGKLTVRLRQAKYSMRMVKDRERMTILTHKLLALSLMSDE